MKENFINILREATNNRTVYEPQKNTNETPSHNSNPYETNYQYPHKNITVPNNSNIEPAHDLNPTNNENLKNNQNNNTVVYPINNKGTNTIIPKEKQDQFVETTPTSSINSNQILLVWQSLFPTIQSGINILPSYAPEPCQNKSYNFNFSGILTSREIARLMREIYLRILRSLDTYSLLIKKENNENLKQIVLLRTQMQVLSSAILNVYQDYTATNVVPLRVSINSYIPKNIKDAYCYLHDEIYCIYFLLSKLFFNLKDDSNFNSQLTTILNNLKYQLYIIKTLYNNIL